jgi:hypothetical protein
MSEFSRRSSQFGVDIDAFIVNPPLLHSWDGGKTWNTGGFHRWDFEPLRAFFDRELTDKRRIIETGCGNSTIFFLFMSRDMVVSVDPDDGVYQRMVAYCTEHSIPTDRHEMYVGLSQIVLPKLSELRMQKFDFALIDGDHCWPSVVVDLYYCNMLLRQGGFIMLDDLHLHSVKEAARFLAEEPGFSLALDLGKSLVFKKLSDEVHPRGWGEQPYIARLSSSYQSWANPNALYAR